MDMDRGGRILIFTGSGEGEEGSLVEYTGKRTWRALRARLTRERQGGDCWAQAWMECKDMAPDTYQRIDIDSSDLRTIHDYDIEEA